jgi:hypothetical protein
MTARARAESKPIPGKFGSFGTFLGVLLCIASGRKLAD